MYRGAQALWYLFAPSLAPRPKINNPDGGLILVVSAKVEKNTAAPSHLSAKVHICQVQIIWIGLWCWLYIESHLIN